MLYWVIFALAAFAVGLQVLARYEMSIQRSKEDSHRAEAGRSRDH